MDAEKEVSPISLFLPEKHPPEIKKNYISETTGNYYNTPCSSVIGGGILVVMTL